MYFEPNLLIHPAMPCQMGVPAAVALLASLTTVLASSDCLDRFQCFNVIYPECNYTSTASLLNVLIRGRPGTEVDVDGFSQVFASLVCHQLGVSNPPSLCVSLTAKNRSSDCNSTSADIGVLELLGGGDARPALSREALITLIQSSQSFFTLAGYHVNVTNEGSTGNTGRNGLFDVPLASWICVGFGLLFSLVFLAKPVWWDRTIMKCWHKYRTQ